MPSLLDLPAEIVLSILHELEVSELYIAIQSHPIFNGIWKSHTNSVSAATLSNSLECFPEAMDLALTASPQLPVNFEEAVEKHKRILLAATCVSDMYDAYLQDVLVYKIRGNRWCNSSYQLAPEDRGACIRAFYWIWKIVLTSQYKPFKASESMNQLPPRAMLFLCEISLWIPVMAYATIYSPIARGRRIYAPLRSRPRLAQHRKWQICSYELWRDAEFRATRQKVWRNILTTDVDEPPIFGDHNPQLHAFLARVRKSLEAQHSFPE